MDETEKTASKPDTTTLVLRWVVGILLAILVGTGLWYGYAFATTSASLRYPTHAHYHFRMQIIVGGTPVNFADDKYQTVLGQDICSAALTKQPVHFHDKLDQFVHIHWDHLTGGILLKDFGWNLIGGTNHTLGYRFDQFPKLVRVPIHGQDLPQPPAGSSYFIYTGDENNYQARSWSQFLGTDLRTFFTASAKSTSWIDALTPTAEAAQANEVELEKLNDVIGNVVIFAQKNQPTPAQIKDRFAHLVPLPESTCAG
jgi:hypothetical protein